MNGQEQQADTTMRIAYGLHSGADGMWGWEVPSASGYSWGTASSKSEALADCIAYLQTLKG
jgi:hypothetical protein